jgi:hypothetical protein
VTDFFASLARTGGVAAVAWGAGWLASVAVCPRGRAFRAERIGWSWAIGAGLVAAMVPLSLLAGLTPGWIPFLILAAAVVAASVMLRVTSDEPESGSSLLVTRHSSLVTSLLYVLTVLGIVLYLLRALTEPMWANDYVAIWGLKGKTIYAAGAIPQRIFEDPSLGFSHPEYPLGLPFLYAGVSFLAGRWDDHAMAVLFPFFQIATLAALFGWLRRRGASRGVAWLATAILACFEPLYSAFLSGMAEVPLSLGLLLFGAALADALDGEPGALRRLAAASALITATKNEGLFFAAVGCAIAVLFGGQRRWKAALAALPTALVVHGLHLAWRGQLPLRDFDFASFSLARAGEALASAARLPGPIGWAEILLLVALVVLGRGEALGSRVLGLCACGLGAYLLFPAFAVRGPEWLAQTTLPRISAGLVPLAAAAVAIRFRERMGGAGVPAEP